MPSQDPRAERNWLQRQAAWLLASALLLLAVFENSRLDLILSGLAFSPETHSFPLQHQAFLNDFMHHGLKMLSYELGLLALLVCLLGWRGQLAWLPPKNALLAALGSLLIPLCTTALKHLTNRHCPWDVVDFGGYAPYVSLFGSTPDNIMHGACFPAGHASAGFAWLAWAVALRASLPQGARRVLFGALALGLAMGLGRLLQGAHFLSHVLWSAWLAWALSLGLACLLKVPLLPSARLRPEDACPDGSGAYQTE